MSQEPLEFRFDVAMTRLYSLLLIRVQMETLSAIVLVFPKYFVENDPLSDCIEKILVKTDMDMRFRATQLKFAVVIYGP